MLTLFHPSTGTVRVKGVRNCPNAVLHAWFKQQLLTILAGLPPAPARARAFDFESRTLPIPAEYHVHKAAPFSALRCVTNSSRLRERLSRREQV
jgi:hypothetical protein